MKRLCRLCVCVGVLAVACAVAQQEILPSFGGVLRSVSGKQLAIATPDDNEIRFHVVRGTTAYAGAKKISLSALRKGQRVSVEARVAPDGSFDAVTVHVESLPREEKR